MSDIDDKLEYIVEASNNGLFWSTERQIARIKAVFAEAGYVKSLSTADRVITNAVKLFNKEHGYMTGQEWYDRFERELKKEHPRFQSVRALEAAKQASRLEEKS